MIGFSRMVRMEGRNPSRMVRGPTEKKWNRSASKVGGTVKALGRTAICVLLQALANDGLLN